MPAVAGYALQDLAVEVYDGKFHPVDYPVLGEIGRTVRGWLDALPANLAVEDQLTELAARWAASG